MAIDRLSAMTVNSVDRAFRLLRAVPATDGTLSGLARETGLAVATVSRLMNTLEQTGAVVRERKVYRIGPAVFELANGEPETYDLLALSVGHLNALVVETGETAGIAEPAGLQHVHLGQVASAHDVSVRDWTGFQAEAHSGCIGFVLMAHWEQRTIDRYLAGTLARFSPYTVVDRETILARLDKIRQQGWFWTTDEYALGVTTVAAPVLDRAGVAVGSLYVHGPSYRFPSARQRPAIGRALLERAQAISGVLGRRESER